jgi:RNA polymerase sigma factor (sigma-70 family)
MKRKNAGKQYEYPEWVTKIISEEFIKCKIYEYGLQNSEDDVRQELIIRLYKKRKEPVSLYYVAEVLHSVLCNTYRQIKKQLKVKPEAESLKIQQRKTLEPPGPLELAIGKDRLELIHSLIPRLKPEDQLLLTLRFQNHYTFKQIGKFMGNKSEGCVRVRYKKIIKKLAAWAGEKTNQNSGTNNQSECDYNMKE